MHLFYSGHIELPVHPMNEEESTHIVRVLRLKEGDTVFLTDGQGTMHHCTITEAVARRCLLRIAATSTDHPNSYRIHIAISPTKNIARFEWFLEKATEIGVDVITPLICTHSERLTIKTERLSRILIAAMKQSWNSWLPELTEPERFSDLIHEDFNGLKLIAHAEAGSGRSLRKAYPRDSSALILIGPEGDFSPEEIDQARKAGFVPVCLGKNRLRTETAGVVVCSVIAARNM
jgi:16S rRNA (uracil1498-N3)-methyltransferase